MNLSTFFEHWRIVENPFRGEEARQDPVFRKLESLGTTGGHVSAQGTGFTTHSDFEKILGDFARPSTAIVFGEKGSGKTAMRLQIADRIAAYNRANPQARCLLVPYDELNPILDRFNERVGSERKPNIPEALAKMRLPDHMDAVLSLIVPRIVDTMLKEGDAAPDSPAGSLTALDLGAEPRRTVRKLDSTTREELLLLQAVYDRAEGAERRTRKLRRVLRLPLPGRVWLWNSLALAGWLLPAALAYWLYSEGKLDLNGGWALYTVAALTTLWLILVAKRLGWDRLSYLRLGHKVRRQVRISGRGDASFARSLRQVDPAMLEVGLLPTTPSEEHRYSLFDRLRRLLAGFGFASIMIIVDRVDEPTLIAGDPERMKSVVWPMLNNKFLQQSGLGVKMLLPMELRHALFRESAAFFQEARLDKQNLIERLSWTGAMLYDLCNARLQACLMQPPAGADDGARAAATPITLLDLFAEDVTRQDIVDALDQMHQPRDAFKMLYQCLVEHCSNVTQDQAQWRIPKLVLDTVKKQQVERVRQLSSGVRPA
jgi:hypothetical protein